MTSVDAERVDEARERTARGLERRRRSGRADRGRGAGSRGRCRCTIFPARFSGSIGRMRPATITHASVTNASAAQRAVTARSRRHWRTQTTAIDREQDEIDDPDELDRLPHVVLPPGREDPTAVYRGDSSKHEPLSSPPAARETAAGGSLLRVVTERRPLPARPRSRGRTRACTSHACPSTGVRAVCFRIRITSARERP